MKIENWSRKETWQKDFSEKYFKREKTALDVSC